MALAALGLGAGPALAGLVVTPDTGLSSAGYFGGPFSPASQVYTLHNDGAAPIVWTAYTDLAPGADWVKFSALYGTLDPGQSTNVTVGFNSLPLDFAPGSYAATVTFRAGAQAADRSVSLTVLTPAAGSWSFGTNLTADQLRIRLTGQTGMEFQVLAAPEAKGPYEPVYTNTFVDGQGSYDITASGARRFFQGRTPGEPAASLSIARIQAENRTVVTVSGSPYGTYVLEASPDGSSWTPVLTNRTSAEGTFVYTTTATDLQYRVQTVAWFAKPDLDHVLIIGESIAIGMDGSPALSTSPSSLNFRSRADLGQPGSFTPLYELGVETIASGAASVISAAPDSRRVLVSNAGTSPGGYADQQKGTSNYELGLWQLQAGAQAAAAGLHSARPTAIFAVAGTRDRYDASYGLNMRQWQADYQADVQRVTGATNPIPIFHSQCSEWTANPGGIYPEGISANALLAEAEANPAKTILVCPRYMLPHASGTETAGLHPSNEGYRWLGEYYGRAYKRVVVEGGSWTPLKPASLTREGAVITITFHVPVAPLVLDTVAVADPGNYGFEYTDDSGAPPAIVSVQLTGPSTNQVQITLAAEPTGANKKVRYAYTGIVGQPGGPTTGPRGNLRDSDPAVSPSGKPLYNWCVHFEKPVN